MLINQDHVIDMEDIDVRNIYSQYIFSRPEAVNCFLF